jgi:exonuclease SbcC
LPYAERSGGEQVKSALAFAFALADVKARRLGIQIGLLFVDEPPYLDEDGTRAYCDALEWLADSFEIMRIIAISHDPRMKSRFTQEINLIKTDEGSRILMA